MSMRSMILIVVGTTVLGTTLVRAMDSGYVPPIAIHYHTDFHETQQVIPQHWEALGGNWSVSNGTYNSIVAAPTAISSIFQYSVNPFATPEPNLDDFRFGFIFRARMLNEQAGSNHHVGVVYNYRDPANYYEALFSPTGTVYLNRVIDGESAQETTLSYVGGGRNVWFDVEIVRKDRMTTLKVNGIAILNLQQDELHYGRVGLITHNTTAKFDKVSVAYEFGPQPYEEQFSGALRDWTTVGDWSISNGILNNTSVQMTNSVDGLGATFVGPEATLQYTLRARMLNPYGASGNLVGLTFNRNGLIDWVDEPGESYGEVVFSPTGVAKLNLIYRGQKHTIATASYNGQRNEWFDVRLSASLSTVSVAVDGEPLFENVSTAPLVDGSAGLITHWAPGKFDDIWYDNRFAFQTLSADFETDAEPPQVLSGNWNTAGGTLNSVAVGKTDVATVGCCWMSDMVVRARLLNQYGASGNLVGIVYNHHAPGPPLPTYGAMSSYGPIYAGDYYEVVFSPTGNAYMNKVINGMTIRVASATHDVPRNTWFDVEVLRLGLTTTVRLNGTVIFDRVQQGELDFGSVGAITHWSRGRFDNFVVRDPPSR